MDKKQTRDEIIEHSAINTEEGKQELYLYSLKKLAEENVKEHRNALTDLHNLKAFFYLCGEMIHEQPNLQYGVIVMDITQFKAVNEFCGRPEGDRMLKFIADCFRVYEDNRPHTYVCQVRADNFCLCTAFTDKQELVDIVFDIKKRIDEFPFSYRVLPSFGISTALEPMPAVSYMKDCATIALNSIKGKFFICYAFFDEEMRRLQLRERQVESDMLAALEQRELLLYVQPKVDMHTGRIMGGEALVRWRHPEKGLICPGDFIPVLEKNGFIINVDAYVWKCVFEYLGQLKKQNRTLVPISINVSRVHAYDTDFCETLLQLMEQYEVPAAYVPLELTERSFLADEDGMFLRLKELREHGFQISMDDFGTGYSSMNMLKNQPMDEIKVDRAFIVDIDNAKSKIVVRHTIDMLKELETKIVVEGVETEEQREFLLQCGCKEAQGFLFYRPMPVEEFDRLLQMQEKQDRS